MNLVKIRSGVFAVEFGFIVAKFGVIAVEFDCTVAKFGVIAVEFDCTVAKFGVIALNTEVVFGVGRYLASSRRSRLSECGPP